MEKIRDTKGWPKKMQQRFLTFALGARYDANSYFYGMHTYLLKYIQYLYARAFILCNLAATVPYQGNNDLLLALMLPRPKGKPSHFLFWAGNHTLGRSFEGTPLIIWMAHNKCNHGSMLTAEQALVMRFGNVFTLKGKSTTRAKHKRAVSCSSAYTCTFEIVAIPRHLVPLKDLLKQQCHVDPEHFLKKEAMLRQCVEVDFEKLYARQ